jgi:hypothetical protein
MKIFCLIMVLCVSHPASSQPVESTRAYRKFSIGALLSPNSSYRMLQYTASHDWLATRRNSNEVQAFGFSSGLDLRWQLNDRIALASGLFYAARGYKTKTAALHWQSASAEFAECSWTKFEYRFIRIPLHVIYSIGKPKRFYLVGGPSANFLLTRATKIYSSFTDHTTSRSDNQDISFTPVQLSVSSGVGFRYPLSERLVIEAEPAFNWFLSSANGNDHNKEFLYAAEFNLRAHYRFKKK